MLRTSVKKELLDLLDAMIVLHHKGLLKYSKNERLLVLQDCQSAAITVGEYIENNIVNSESYISILEDYCENIYQLTERETIPQELVWDLDKMVYEEIAYIKSVKSKYQVVFFPYKASMWDSLESIWKAANKDERCECLVIPIPYFEFDDHRRIARCCYEGDNFPDYVPITNYQEYNLEKERPDIAYIHNPYDDYNYVTSVHPAYYSRNLKKYVNKLVYVPYYVSSGFVSNNQKCVPVYTQMDYMIAQSENFKKGFEGLPYRNKILALGSPKFDKVIQMCKERKSVPKEWKDIFCNRKTVMLNTSINCFLNNGEIMLDKLKKIFEIVEKTQGVVLIWRPHPLIKATIDSMRPQLGDKYYDLEHYFIENKVGILDCTPDVTKTVAIADAYVGEVSSSVVNLFGAAGKPIFALNNYITQEFSLEQKREIAIADMIEIDGEMWIIPLRYNGLFSMKMGEWNKVQFMGRIDQGAQWSCAATCLLNENDKLFLASYDVESINVFEMQKKRFCEMGKGNGDNVCAIGMVKYNNKIFYILQYQDAILEYNIKTEKWKFHENIFAGLKIEKNECIYNVWDYSVYNEYLWTTTNYGNKILQFNMANGKAEILEIGDASKVYSGIVCDFENLYLAESHTGEILCINLKNGEQVSYEMPSNFFVFSDKTNKATAHKKLLNMRNSIVTIPHNGNSMVKIDKATGESHLIIPDFWRPTSSISNGYNPQEGVAFFAKATDENHVFVQRLCDNALAHIDVETEDYEIHYPRMTEESFNKFIHGQDGFEKVDMRSGFYCKETRIFSVTDFFARLVNGDLDEIHEKQIKNLSSMAANLDGTCGERVHVFMMEQLEQP